MYILYHDIKLTHTNFHRVKAMRNFVIKAHFFLGNITFKKDKLPSDNSSSISGKNFWSLILIKFPFEFHFCIIYGTSIRNKSNEISIVLLDNASTLKRASLAQS